MTLLPADADAYTSTLHTLSLDTLPLTHPMLRKSRMVKNARFESVVELYRDKKSGSGQQYVDTVATMLGLNHKDGPDLGLLRNIAMLPTFDIFSVRLLLRDIGVSVAVSEPLPPEVGRAIEAQMRKFTIPLLRYVYGSDSHAATDLSHLVLLFRDPDGKRAEEHLKRLADRLKIPVLQVPRFLEDYSDTFLAISFYQHTYFSLKPSVDEFLGSIASLKTHFQRSHVVISALDRVHADFSQLMKSTAKRLNASEQLANLLWGEGLTVPMDTLQSRIREFQFLLGHLMCGISVKIAAWTNAFPRPQAGTPKKCVELITTDIVYALGQLRTAAESGLQRRAPPSAVQGATGLQAFLRTFSQT